MNTPRQSLVSSSLEALESRIAPASVLTYTDVDGDTVRVISTKGDINAHATFSDQAGGHQLETLDLTDPSFSGTSLRFIVKAGPHGDGLANVGFINATGNDLGRIVLPGDLGRIVAGDGNAARPAIVSLAVTSMGQFGDATQGGSGNTPFTLPQLAALNQLLGNLTGNTGGLLHDLLNDTANTLDSGSITPTADRLLNALASDLRALGDSVGTDGLDLTKLTPGLTSLLRSVLDDVDQITHLTGDDGSILTGDLALHLPLVSVQVGDILGLSIPTPGGGAPIDIGGLLGIGGVLPVGVVNLLNSLTGTIGNLTNLGSGGLSSLPLPTQGLIGTVLDEVNSLLGGSPLSTGSLHDLSHLQTDLNSLLNLAHVDPTSLASGVEPLLTSLSSTVNSLLGSSSSGGSASGEAVTSVFNGSVGAIAVRTNLDGVHLDVHGNLGSLRVGGSIFGGDADNSGVVTVSGNLGSFLVKRNVIGGDGVNSGSLDVTGKSGTIRIGGSLSGGEGTHSGSVSLSSDAARLAILGDLVAHGGPLSGSIINDEGSIGNLGISGNIITAGDGDGLSVFVQDHITNFAVRKGILGDEAHRISVIALGERAQVGHTNYAVRNFSVGASLSGADVLLGYDLAGDAANGSAQLASLRVNGDLIASNVIVGTEDSGGNGYGNQDDRTIAEQESGITSRIVSIIVRGQLIGTPEESGDHYGIEAHQIDKVFLGRSRLAMTPGASGDVVPSTGSDDYSIREVSQPAAA